MASKAIRNRGNNRINMRVLPTLPTIAAVALIGVLISGCSFGVPRPTAEPIYVTATPEPILATPTPKATTVLGATPLDAPSPEFPTLEPATVTPKPPAKPTLTPSFTPTPTESPVPKGTKTALAAQAPGNCVVPAQGGFATIYQQDPTAAADLGCPVSAAVAVNSATLGFQNGSMAWASQYADVQGKVIYVLYKNNTYQRFSDVWAEGVNPETTGETAPAGLFTPVRGFGKIWHDNANVKNSLGWATGTETGTSGQMQRFERGEMYFIAGINQTIIFVSTTNSWRTNPTHY